MLFVERGRSRGKKKKKERLAGPSAPTWGGIISDDASTGYTGGEANGLPNSWWFWDWDVSLYFTLVSRPLTVQTRFFSRLFVRKFLWLMMRCLEEGPVQRRPVSVFWHVKIERNVYTWAKKLFSVCCWCPPPAHKVGPEGCPPSAPAPCSAPAEVHCPVYSSQSTVMLPQSENYGPLGATWVFSRLSCKTEKPPCPASSPTPPSLPSILVGVGGKQVRRKVEKKRKQPLMSAPFFWEGRIAVLHSLAGWSCILCFIIY